MNRTEHMYSVSRLRLLREVSLRGTLAAAAEALGYNPSSVSHQLKLLEQEVGARLLEPVGRKVRLTGAAAILVRHAEAILERLEQAEAEIALAKQRVVGTVRVATFQTGAHTVIPSALKALQTLHPELDIRVAHIPVEAAIPGLLARDYDLVLQEDYPGHPHVAVDGAEITPLGMDELWLVTPESFQGHELQDLAGTKWIMEPTGTLARRWALSVCRNAGYEPLIAFESSDVLLHVLLVSEGLGAALIPGLALASADRTRIQASPLPGLPARRISLAVRSGSSHSPAIAAVRDALSSSVAARLAPLQQKPSIISRL